MKEERKSEEQKSPDSSLAIRVNYQTYQEVKMNSTKVTAQLLKQAGVEDSESISSTSQEDDDVNEIIDDGAQYSNNRNGSESSSSQYEDSESAQGKILQNNQQVGD